MLKMLAIGSSKGILENTAFSENGHSKVKDIVLYI
jgi:hypothetical protein